MEQRDLVGETILGYKVVAKVGSGSFGTVYKAIKSNVIGDYTRALKHIAFPTARQYASVLNSMGGDACKADDYFAETLRGIAGEINLLSSLSEKGPSHIIRYYESDLEITDSPRRYDVFVLMEYATSLSEHIAQSRAFNVGDVARMGIEVLEGIKVCHDNGVIHRDIKEDNIFVNAEGQFVLGDFGVSKVLKDSSRAESMKGTPNYLAPEVYLGRGGYTKSVDLYSLGIVLYRLLNYGRNPFLPPFPSSYFAEDEDKALRQRMSGEVAPLPPLGGDAIGEVVVKAISGADQRYQDADSFISALSVALESTSEVELSNSISCPIPLDPMAYVRDGGERYGGSKTFDIGIGRAADMTDDCVGEHVCVPQVPFWGNLASGDSAPGCCVDNYSDSFRSHEGNASEEGEPTGPASEGRLGDACERAGLYGGGDEPHPGQGTHACSEGLRLSGKGAFWAWIALLVMALLVLLDPRIPYRFLLAFCGIAISLCGLSFIVGKAIHTQRHANPSALMQDEAIRLIVSDARANVTASSLANGCREISCTRLLDRLESRILSEPKFGYSSAKVTFCENEITEKLRNILETASRFSLTSNAESGDNLLAEIESCVAQTNHLLDKRRRLMRR